MAYQYFINNRKLCTTNPTHVPVSENATPVLYFGEVVAFTFTFPQGVLNVGDTVKVSVDVNKDFLHSLPMASATITVANATAISITLDTRTARFRDVINDKPNTTAFFEIARWRNETGFCLSVGRKHDAGNRCNSIELGNRNF